MIKWLCILFFLFLPFNCIYAEKYIYNEEGKIVEPDYPRYIARIPDDTYYENQWHLDHIDAPIAWDSQRGNASTIIAVLDTGADIDHPDLADKIWVNKDEIPDNGKDDDKNGFIDDVYGWDFVNNNKNPNPNPNNRGDNSGVNHGTHIAGIIAADTNNAAGVSGICWNCKIMPIQVMDDEGIGYVSAISKGIEYAIANGASIINMSFGSYIYSQTENKAVEDALDAGMILIAAAGNEGKNLNKYPFYPACHDNVIGVSSIGRDGKRSSFSNYGSNCVDVSAPGENIVSTYYYKSGSSSYNYYYGYLSGTSMAAPVVSGIAGLLKSSDKSFDQDDIIYSIGNTANASNSLAVLNNAPTPLKPEKIYAYTGYKKKTPVLQKTNSADRTPYFTWDASAARLGHIDGYYIYWGADKNADPVREGDYHTKKRYNVDNHGHIKASKTKVFYLKVKAKNNYNKISKNSQTFIYYFHP